MKWSKLSMTDRARYRSIGKRVDNFLDQIGPYQAISSLF